MNHFRQMLEQLHNQHGKTLHHVGKVGISAEMVYHVAEIVDAHHALIGATCVLLLVTVLKALFGET